MAVFLFMFTDNLIKEYLVLKTKEKIKQCRLMPMLLFVLKKKGEHQEMKLFFDMDGTLSVFNKDAGPDEWSAPGYARGLMPLGSMTRALKLMLRDPKYYGEEVEIYILSAVVSMDYAVEDKKAWLKEWDINLPDSRLVFVPYGQSKAKALKDAGIEIAEDGSDLFIDDYTKNLFDMEDNTTLTPVKLLNGINDTNKSWPGTRVSAFSSPRAIADTLMGISWTKRATSIAA